MMGFLSRPALKRPALALMLGTVLLLIAAGCGGGDDKQVTGLVLEAVDRNLAEIELLRIRDDDGKVWEFSTEGNVGITAAHLRQHRLSGERIIVTYREVGGRLIASDLKDADGPGG